MVHIQFLSNDITSALIPVLSLKPDRAIFLYDNDEISPKRVNSIVSAVRKKLPRTTIICETVDRFEFADVADKLKNIEVGNEMIYFGTAGSTESVSIGALFYCYKMGGVPFYTDFEQKTLNNAITGEKICEIAPVSLDDYIRALGAKREGQMREKPSGKDFFRIKKMAEWIFAHEGDWHTLCASIQKTKRKKGEPELWFYAPQRSLGKTLERLKFYGFIKECPGGEGWYEAESDAVMGWLKTYGYWLEMYTYINGLKFFDETEISVKFDWDGSDRYLTENEIDVIGIKDSIPWFISCKMSDIEPSAMHEISNLAIHFGGPNSKKFIATTGNKASDNRRAYMRKMHIGLIDVTRFYDETPEKVFSDAKNTAEEN